MTCAIGAVLALADAAAAQKTYVDPNVNMVKGITFPTGDPYLQRQTEPSIAVSTRNPCHLLAGANDYRSIDIPFDTTVPPGAESSLSMGSDAWLGVFKSFDCGAKWQSTLLPGYPQDNSGRAPQLKGYAAGADPTVRAGTNGLFYYSGMVFNRAPADDSKIFIARYIDNNNKERGDPIDFIDVSVIDTGTKGYFLDKPWLAVDVPRTSFGPGSTLPSNPPTCNVRGQVIPAGNAYVAWARFTGANHDHTKLMFAKSTDCGQTWKSHPVSNNQHVSQGASLAIAPNDGTLYLTWREFAFNGKPVNFWVVVSTDGGETFSNPKMIAANVTTFDQPKSTTTFRSNALPTITADHQNRVYVAWSARGAGWTLDVNGVRVANTDARIMIAVSKDRGVTWAAPVPLDPSPRRGHQLMPSLAFAAGKIQAIWYDQRDDKSGSFTDYIADTSNLTLRHTIDIRGAQATPADLPVFVSGSAQSLKVSQYRSGIFNGQSIEVGANAPNIPMYANATIPFVGDYIDVTGLSAFPVQTTSGQVWQPNIGPINLLGGQAANISTAGFPTLPIFHATWTDNRDVRAAQCNADPSATGQRNANIYTARLTPGLFVGSPGNTKPLGNRLNPKTNQQELIQRGFVVFAQNTTDTLKFYRFQVMQQPPGGRASFKQFEKPGELQSTVTVSIPKQSTVARTLYVTSSVVNAQILVNVEEMTPIEVSSTGGNGGTTVPKEWTWTPTPNGLRGSVLLNPDQTNPKILDPDVESAVPQIAKQEVHDPSMFDAQFFRRATKSRKLDVMNPDPENPDPENPDPENPDPENPDPQNPDPQNLTVPNPDPENPDPENPDPENASLLNTAISDAEVQSSAITDIQWRIHNSGNTTSAYRFRPSLPSKKTDTKYQLIVTRRSMALSLGNATQNNCKPIYRSTNQVLVNIQNFTPKTPDPQNPDPQNPDPQNPDPENPDPQNPDPQNPDPENANFFLAPGETATVTLREFDFSGSTQPPAREQFAAKTAAVAANTDETQVTTTVTGPDLTLTDVPATISPAIARPGRNATVTFTLANRGTGNALTTSNTPIKTRVYLSTDTTLSAGDTLVTTINEPSPFAFCPGVGCSTASTVSVPLPTTAGQYYVIVITDEDRDVFEADELNNRVTLGVRVEQYQLTFAAQPSNTTQDFTITPSVVVALTHPDTLPVTAADVAGVTLPLQNNPAAGTLAGTLVAPNAGGLASFGNLQINNVGTGYSLAASALFANGAVSAPFNIETDLPPVVANETYATNEDQLLTIAAPGVLTNDSDPPAKGTKPASYVFDAVKATDPANGTVTVNADGSFTYTPNLNFAGADSFTYRARDGRPGNSTTGTVTVNVTAINDAPIFTKGADQTELEDSGDHTVPAWASNISPGAPNESAQVVDFIVSNNNNALFTAQPALASNGTLTYTSAPNANGVATVTVRIHDNGGTANGGVDTSAPQTFTIAITAVNDAPVTVADSYSTNEDNPLVIDAGGGLLANDTDIDTGTTLVAEYLTIVTNGTLLPNANGSFSYTPNPNFFGVDGFTYRANDGTTAGNTVTVTINVAAVNDVPVFTKGADQTATMNTGAQSVTNWATGISAGPANEAAQVLNFIVTNSNAAIFAVAPAISAAGTLTYTPSVTVAGTATVTVQLHDNGGTANGGVDTSSAQTFTITVINAPTTFVVTNTNDSGAGSLRQAILTANANLSADTITFNIPGGGVRTITPLSPLPQIVFPVVVDATTQPGFSGAPLIELNGSSAGPAAVGFNVYAENVTIRGFIVNRFQQTGIALTTANNSVVGNYIGTNADGTSALGNFVGVFASVGPNLIGGSTAADRNVISGNTNVGLQIQKYTGPGVSVKGNYIGTNVTGTGAVPNAQHGVFLVSVSAAQIGGDNAGEGNVISGNGWSGIQVLSCETPTVCGTLIVGNKIGTNAAGTAAIPNGLRGIDINLSPNNTIRGNLISGNGIAGMLGFNAGIHINSELVSVDPQAELRYGNHLIVGNKIGTDITGIAPIPNLTFGIVLSRDTKAVIGGTNVGDRNIIAYNGDNGVYVGYTSSSNNTIVGNYIGVNANLQPAGNQFGGISVGNGSANNLIRDNVVSSNANFGMSFGQASHHNTIQGNFVGTDPTGVQNLGNAGNGISLLDGSYSNSVSANRVAFNQNAGLLVQDNASIANRISQNAIYSNVALGIDLGTLGVTANDAGDGDTGANNLQNFPVISGAFVNGGSTLITGTLNSAANTAYTVELFSSAAADASGYGEGQTYLASLNVTTDGSGNAAFSTTLPALSAGSFVTATATDPNSNTSEFSQARIVIVNNPPTATSDDILTVSDLAMTGNPAANDVDPDVANPSVRTTYRPVSGAFGPLLAPGGVAVVTSTGRGYFTGGNLAAGTTGKIGILDLTTNTVVGTIPLPGNFSAALTEVDQAAQIVFFRGGINLLAVDARPASPTFNQLVLNINLGTINSWALDSPHHRLYVTTQTTGTGLIISGRVTVFDTDPVSPTFLQVIAEAPVPSLNGTATAIGVNTVTNKLYVSVTGNTPGLYAADPATLAMTQIFSSSSTGNITSIAINDVDNLIYAAGQTALHAVDGSNNTKVGQVALGGNASTGFIGSRVLIHRGTGRVFVRVVGFPNPSNLVVVDGKRGSPTINTIVGTINLGRENSTAFMAIDEGINRLIATSSGDLRSHIIDTTNNAIVATIMATQTLGRVSLDPVSHRAYLTGGLGYIKVTDLAAAALVTDIHVGTEVFSVAIDPLTHGAYVSETGLATAVKRLNETGISGAVALPHGDGREGFAIRNSVTNKIYVLNIAATAAGGSDALPGFVHVIDGNSNTVTASVPVGPNPFGLAVDEVNNKIFAGNGSQGASFVGGISIIDGATNVVTQANMTAIPSFNTPHNITIGRDMVVTTSGRLYFRVTGGAATQMLGMLNGNAASQVNIGNVNVNIIRYNPVLNRLYVGASNISTGANQVLVIDPISNAVVATLAVGSPTNFITNQSYIAVNQATGRVFITDFDGFQLTAVDGNNNTVVATIPMPFGPSTVAVDEVRNRVYVGSAIARSLTIVDGASMRVVRSLALPIAPVRLEVDSTMSPARIYATATANEGAISVIDDPGTAAPQITSVTQGLHGGVVLNADGSVTYTPTGGYVGTDSYTYTTSDGQGGTTTGTANVTVYAEMLIQPATLANGMVGQNYSQQLTRTGGSGANVAWTVTSFFLPGGLHLSTTGLLSGKLQQSGTFTFTVSARDLGQDLFSESRSYTIIVGPPVLAPTGVPSATVNVPYSTQLFAGGATGAVTWSLDTVGHPALSWLSLSNTGVLSGTPTAYGTTPSFTVTATDSSTPTAQTTSRTYSIFVTGPLTMADLREGIVLETEPSVFFLGGNGTRTVTNLTGPQALPPGITLGSGGVFTGTPLRHGTYNFTLELRDSSTPQQVVQKNIAWSVSAKDQQGNSGSVGPTLSFGTTTGRKLAQVFTVGAQGTLTGIGLQNLSCQAQQTTVKVEIQRLLSNGVPDGVTIAAGSTQANFNAIAISPPVAVAIGERLAFIASVDSPLTCTFANVSLVDQYNAGDAYTSTGGGWTRLFDTAEAVLDIPSFRTLIQPAMDVTYLPTSHGGNTVTLLNNGKVLIAGGSSTRNAELYDPATNTTTATGNMTMVRQNATATLLGDGTVLITGGRDESGNKNAQAEIYDPNTGTFTPTNGNLSNARESHRAVRYVSNNVEKVLITGGTNSVNTTLAAVEIYDPVTKTFSMSNNNLLPRQSHAAVLLNTGKILLAGGYGSGSGPSAELFDPATNLFTATGNMQVSNRGLVTGTLLSDGKVLIAGGQSGDVRNEAEVYNPATGLFTATGNMSSRRYIHTATLLADGSVLIAGGYDEQSFQNYTSPLATMERYVPGTGTFVSAGAMETRRASHAAVRLGNDKVLLAGGFSQSWMTGNTGELYDVTASPTFTPTTLVAGTPGSPYSVTFTPAGGSGAPYTISHLSGVLPAGLAFSGTTLSGTLTATSTGVYQFALQVKDGAQHTIVQSLTLQVGSVNTITSPYRLNDAPQNKLYSYQLTATGPSPVWSLLPPTSTSTTNAPPTGITLSSGGLLSGTPTSQGYYTFGVRAIDALGVEATKVVAISVPAPLAITTTTLPNPELFGGLSCVNTSNGNGQKTYSIVSGALPSGVTFNGTTNNSCISFSGQPKQTGVFTFRVRVTDSSFSPQSAEQSYTINVYAADQQSFSGGGNGFSFGAGTGTKLAERVITAITGTLRGIRTQGLTCTANGTSVSVEIQGLDPAGKPNGQILAAGTGVSPLGTIYLNSGLFFTADEPFALVFDAGASCNLKPSTFDSSPGDGFISNGGGGWQRLNEFDPTRHDVPFVSIVEPVAGLTGLNYWRGRATETLLGNGKVLIAGGDCCQSTSFAEVFDPATNTTTATGAMAQRQQHTATLLPNGKVLLTGGNSFNGVRLATAELYDPATNTFTATGALNTARNQHRATLLLDGTVLITGGFGANTQLNLAEIYNPASGTFTALGTNMISSRHYHTATLLADGRVLIAGGYGSGGGTGEIYTPGSQTFTAASSFMTTGRAQHTATLLDNGKVLLAGGNGSMGEAVATTELFDPAAGANGTFTVSYSMSVGRIDQSAVKLGDGSVLIAGGITDNTCCYPHAPTAVMERYVPGTGIVNAGAALVSRSAHSATLMGNGKVLLAGTFGYSSAAGRTAELFDAAAMPPYLQVAETSGASGAPLNFTLQPAGGSGSGYTMSVLSGSLPNGAQLNLLTGQLTGTPTQSGTFRLTIKIVDGAGRTSYQIFTLRIDPITITTTSLPTGYQGVSYTGSLSAIGQPNITWSLVGNNTLPAGLMLNANTGAITGSPTNSCCFYSFTVKATDGLGQTTQKALSISLQQALSISTTTLGDGWGGWNYYGGIYRNGGTSPVTWSISGQPLGLQINPSTGQFLTAYPANALRQAGSFTIAANVTDTSTPQQSASRNLTLNVYTQDQGIGSANLPDVTLPSTRRIAQVFQSASSFPLHGIQVWALNCGANVVLTGKLWPVTPGLEPDETGSPFATGTLTSNASGFFPSSNLIFASPVAMAAGTSFAVVFEATGTCVQKYWSDTDYYSRGNAWVSDNHSTWTLASSVATLNRADLPMSTLVMPPLSLRFTAGWRGGHVSAVLNDGRVLLAGSEQYTEVFDPATNIPTLTADMSHARQGATATKLPNGKVLIAGGSYWNGVTSVAAATTQVFDPATGTFGPGQNMSSGRFNHTATLLANGKVLLAGGDSYDVNGNWTRLQSADLFDGNGNFIAAVNMTGARSEHTATLLADGLVVVIGGWTGSPNPTGVAEIYDPASAPNGAFAPVMGWPGAWPAQHTATLITTGARAGQVLIAGGTGNNYPILGDSYFFDPATPAFSAAPPLLVKRSNHAATTLPNGRIVFSGGISDWSTNQSTNAVEIYDPMTGERALVGSMLIDRYRHTADAVTVGGATKLVMAGGYSNGGMSGRTIEMLDLGPLDGDSGSFAPSAPLLTARQEYGTALLPDGKVLIAGGNTNTTASEVYDPATGTTTAVPNMIAARCYGCAVAKLLDGRILVAGGSANGYVALASAEIFDPVTNTWGATGNMPDARLAGLAVVLNSGLVLITGGTTDGTTSLGTSVLFNPATGTFSYTGSMAIGRYVAAVSKLADGRVLVAGGLTPGGIPTNTAEVYDPLTGTFSPTGSMITARGSDYATLLLDGRVLIAGSTNTTDLAEVYNPGSGTFTAVGSMTTPRSGFTVVRLNNGLVLVMGGGGTLASTEIFDPMTNLFTRSADMATPRRWGRAILLSDGRVMISGGQDTNNVILSSVEIFTPNQ